jgi:hypothetical protein
MQQRDYILRMIEQIGAALARLREMIVGGTASPDMIQSELRTTGRGVGVDLDMARMASADTLADLVSVGGEVNPTRCWLTAELLFLDALEAEVSGDADAAWSSYDKALRLFSLLKPGGGFIIGWPEAATRVEEVRDRLAALEAEQ